MIGTTLQNRYRIDAELGRGGMGVVYRAHDTLPGRDVTVKVLSETRLGTEGRARLVHEAQAVDWERKIGLRWYLAHNLVEWALAYPE